MEALLLYYIRTKCNKDNASAIGEKRIQDELELPESTVEGYIKKAERIYRYTIHKDFNP